MNGRRAAGLAAIFVLMAAVIAGVYLFAPDLDERLTPTQLAPVAIIIGVALAVLMVALYLALDLLTPSRPPAETPDLMKMMVGFNERTLGVADEATLAAAVSEMLSQHLKVHTSAFLLLTQSETSVTLQPVAARREVPLTALEFSRQNLLLRQLSQRRIPLRQAELQIDPHYSQMPAAERQWLTQLGGEVYAPLFDAGVLTAILMVGPQEDRRPFLASDLKVIGLLAAQSAAVLKTVRTLAEQRELKDALQALNDQLRQKDIAVAKMDSSRGDFLAIASHELRTPITQLLGFADLLGSMVQDQSLDMETVAHVTDSIVRACARLNEVISQILDMAQLDVNALDLKFKATSLEVILKEAIAPYVNALRERRLALKITGLKGLPPLQADEARLVQALSQLMSNAIKFTPDGRPIEIALKALPAEGNQPPSIQITFADSGIGIDPQYQQAIFEKFFRIGSSSQHSTSTTKFMGAGPGLGLPIAKGVVERHGGRLWVESEGCDPQKLPGTRFHVLLPLKPPAFDPRALETAGGDKPARSGNLPRQNPFIDA